LFRKYTGSKDESEVKEIIEAAWDSLETAHANEKLLQLEIMNILSSMDTVLGYLPEKLFDESSSKKCDF